MRRTGADNLGDLPEMADGEKLNGKKPHKGVVGHSNERRSRTGKSHRGKGRGALLVSAPRKLPDMGRQGDYERAGALHIPRCAAPQGATNVIRLKEFMPKRVRSGAAGIDDPVPGGSARCSKRLSLEECRNVGRPAKAAPPLQGSGGSVRVLTGGAGHFCEDESGDGLKI